MRARRNNTGFTLIEMLVTGIITAILGTIFLTFLRVHNQAVNEGVACASMQMQSEIVSSQLGRMIRTADLVLSSDEAWSANPGLASRKVHSVVIYGTTGVAEGSYNITGGTKRVLMEQRSGIDTAQHVVRCGKDTITFDTGSVFMLSPDRKQVTLDLDFKLTYRNSDYLLPAKRNMYRCRN